MHEALVEDSQHDIDSDHRREDEQRLIDQRGAEHLRGAGEAALHGGGHRQIVHDRLHRLHRLAQRHARGQIERHRRRGKLAGVIDHQGGIGGGDLAE